MILVTGGAGYIGAVLVEELLKRGNSVRVYDRFYFGWRAVEHLRDQVEFVQGDIRTFDPAALDGVTAVAHLAGLSNDPMAEFNPKANLSINVDGTRAVAEACKQRGVPRLVFASSASIYDKGLYAEDILQDETAEVEPRAAYAVSKFRAERALLELCDDAFCPVILRQGTVYGYSPRMRYDLVVNTFVRDALLRGRLSVFCGGEMWRPLVDVVDVARAHVAALEAPADLVRGEVFNVSYKNYRILELAHWVREALKDRLRVEIEVDYEDRKARSYRIASKKIETVLDFEHQIAVKDSIDNMLAKIGDEDPASLVHPRYHNIEWMKLLQETERVVERFGTVF